MSIGEYQIINKVLTDRDYGIITDNFLTDEYFEQTSEEYQYLKHFYEAYKEVPDKEMFTAKFPEFEYFHVNQSVISIIDDLREKVLFKRAVSLINKCSDLFTEDANRGARYLLDHIEELQPSYSFTCTDIVHDVSRYTEWQNKLNNTESYFIPSGFPELDEYTFGWKRKEEFALIMARSGVGGQL